MFEDQSKPFAEYKPTKNKRVIAVAKEKERLFVLYNYIWNLVKTK